MKKKAYIFVNRHTILRNSKHGEKNPPIGVRIGKSGQAKYVSELNINGPCKIIYTPEKPILKCGARLVIEVDQEYVNS